MYNFFRPYFVEIADKIRELSNTTDRLNINGVAMYEEQLYKPKPYDLFYHRKSYERFFQLPSGLSDLEQEAYFEDIDFSAFSPAFTNDAEDLSYMFANFRAFDLKDVVLDLSSAKDLSYMYGGAKISEFVNLTLKETGIDLPFMRNMFDECVDLKKIKVSILNNYLGNLPNLETLDFIKGARSRVSLFEDLTNTEGNLLRNMPILKTIVIRDENIADKLEYYKLNNSLLSGNYFFTGEVNETYNPNGEKRGRIYVVDRAWPIVEESEFFAEVKDLIRPLSSYNEE